MKDPEFVGHTHSVAANQVLCSPMAEKFADSKLFPDEIVCCGARSVFVPYTDPGLQLSQVIREKTVEFMDEFGKPPRIILLANHGIIALGKTPGAVSAPAREKLSPGERKIRRAMGRFDRLQAVPMRRRGDDHTVDVANVAFEFCLARPDPSCRVL